MKDNSSYFISEYADEYFFHGGIGIIDAERILERNGFAPIRLPHHYSYSFAAKMARFWFVFKTLMSVKKHSVVVFIHPLHARLNKWLVRMLARKNVRMVCMIGDINGLKDGDASILKSEIELFRKFKYFIAHNQGMSDWLKKLVPEAQITTIEFFDFLTDKVRPSSVRDSSIVFAGNLDKSKFLLHLKEIPLHFHLYGPGISQEMLDQPNVEYHGVLDPYELPEKLSGSYGLLWDGESIADVKGSLGNYMQYISHHKLSLYIVSGLPIITTCSSAAASIVKKYRIGICVNKMNEISRAIDNISDAQYAEMVNNMKPIAKKIATGNGLSSALEKLIDQMN